MLIADMLLAIIPTRQNKGNTFSNEQIALLLAIIASNA